MQQHLLLTTESRPNALQAANKELEKDVAEDKAAMEKLKVRQGAWLVLECSVYCRDLAVRSFRPLELPPTRFAPASRSAYCADI